MAESTLKRIELAIRRTFLRMLERRGRALPQGEGWTPAQLLAELGPTPTILFLRQDRLGDVIMSTPIMLAVRERYPNARLLVLLGRNNAAAKSLLPFEAEIFIYQKNLLKDWSTIRALRKQRIDLVIDMTDKASVTASILVGLIQAKLSLGIQKENGTIYDIVVPRLNQDSVHVARRTAEMLRPLGIDPDLISLQPRIALASIERIKGRVGFNISARVPERCAPTEASATIARELAKLQEVLEVVILFDPSEHDRAVEVVRMASDSNVVLGEPTSSFIEFAEHISACEYLITTDTSAIQLGAALDIPMLVLLNPTPGEHFWTPQGVPFEEWLQEPALRDLEPQPAIALFKRLVARTHSAANEAPPNPS